MILLISSCDFLMFASTPCQGCTEAADNPVACWSKPPRTDRRAHLDESVVAAQQVRRHCRRQGNLTAGIIRRQRASQRREVRSPVLRQARGLSTASGCSRLHRKPGRALHCSGCCAAGGSRPRLRMACADGGSSLRGKRLPKEWLLEHAGRPGGQQGQLLRQQGLRHGVAGGHAQREGGPHRLLLGSLHVRSTKTHWRSFEKVKKGKCM